VTAAPFLPGNEVAYERAASSESLNSADKFLLSEDSLAYPYRAVLHKALNTVTVLGDWPEFMFSGLPVGASL